MAPLIDVKTNKAYTNPYSLLLSFPLMMLDGNSLSTVASADATRRAGRQAGE